MSLYKTILSEPTRARMSSSDPLFLSIATILNQSQHGHAGHDKLLKKLRKLFNQVYAHSLLDFLLIRSIFFLIYCFYLTGQIGLKEFFDKFVHVMLGSMVSMAKNPHVDNIIEFIATFSASLGKGCKEPAPPPATGTPMDVEQEETEIDEEDDGYIFLTQLLNQLIEASRSGFDAIRYRACQIISRIMSAVSNDQCIDEDMFERLSDALLERLRDINSRVIVQAIAAIYRLQDPNDRECRVIKVLVFILNHDPHWQVRYQALSHVAFSKQTLPEIIDRVRDPHALVRRKALIILSEKVLIKFINIEKRLFILRYALKDDESGVVETCCRKLLPSWLAAKENDLCKLLKALDVVEARDTVELMLNKMHETHALDSICSEFADVMLDERHFVPMDKLDAESVFYWWWVCSKCTARSKSDKAADKASNKRSDKDHEQDNDGDDDDDCTLRQKEQDELEANTQDKIESEDHLDRILPSLTEFCDYIVK